MTLLEDWKLILKQAWSIRLAVLAALLSAAEYGLQYFAPEHATPGFALWASLLSAAAALARLVAQPQMWESKGAPDDQKTDE